MNMLIEAESSQRRAPDIADAERTGEWGTALAQYESALLSANTRGDFPRAADLLRAIGRLHFERGDYRRALHVFAQSLTQAEATGNAAQTGAALNCMGVVEQFLGEVDTAEGHYRAAAGMAEQSGDQKLAGLVQQNLGALATVRGEYDAALEYNQGALAAFRVLNDEMASARVLNNIGMLHVDLGQLGHAELSYRSAFTLAERNGDAGLRVKIQINRAELALARQDLEAAHEFCDEAFREYTRLGSESGLSETYKVYGNLYRESGNLQLASTHFTLALKLAQTCGDRVLEAECEREQANLHMQEGKHRDALSALNRAHRLFQQLRANREIADIERKLDRVEKMYLRVAEMLETEVSISFDSLAVEQYQRVARYAAQLAAAVGFTGRELTWLRIGAFLYDIGKRSIPEKILNKPGALDAAEWEEVKQHVTHSEQVVIDLDPPWDMASMVRHHHEHWDGTGYPAALSGEEIPMAARVLCIADAFTALTSRRTYRKQYSEQEALDIMAAEAGKTFDPALFTTFRNIVEVRA
jgi:HD-GYP domain-containing protein (c-di-GMP phosphodiesterase class II)/Tfp pilus assembly protein PilF